MIAEHQCEFVFKSPDEQEHVRGVITWVENTQKESLDILSLEQRCSARSEEYADQHHHPQLAFGPRWDCLRRVSYGSNEAIATLSLPDVVSHELADYPMHPAVIDMATGCAQALINDGRGRPDQLFVPAAYSKITCYKPLTTALKSYVRYREPPATSHDIDVAVFDITIVDAEGQILVSIDEFTMQKVKADNAQELVAGDSIIDTGENNQKSAMLEKTLSLGLLPKEGAEAFLHILRHGHESQYAVSCYNLMSVIEALKPEISAQKTVEHLDDDPKLLDLEAQVVTHEALSALIIRDYVYTDQIQRVAFYVVNDDSDVTVSELRRFARDVIANADEVPQHFVECESMPLTATGDIDRYQLENPFAPADTFVAPASKTEVLLAKVWQQVLGVEKVGRHDNFFDIGGHSLLSIRVITKLSKQLGVKLAQSTMVLQTLEQIANDIDDKLGTTHPLIDDHEKPKTENSVDHSSTSHAKVSGGNVVSTEEFKQSATPESSQASSGFLKKMFGRKS